LLGVTESSSIHGKLDRSWPDHDQETFRSGTGTGTYPHRNAAVSIASEVATNFNKTADNFNGIYPAFSDIEISGSMIQRQQ
jgi:hypothetical protein